MNNVRLVKASNIACPHAFSTRLGGVSGDEFESLNLGRLGRLDRREEGDDPLCVAENWRRFGEAAEIDTTRFVHGHQVHGNEVRIARREDAHGILEPSSLTADGYVTDIPGLPLAVFTADCLPLLLYEPEAGIVGAVHCGWRGTAADIMGVAVEKIRELGGDVRALRAALGPCIRRCCFQTGPEVPEAMEKLLDGCAAGLYVPDPSAAGKFRVDLPGVVRRRLENLGLLPEHIEDTGECTMCQPEKYWSHRTMGLRRGSQANIIML